MDDRNDVFELLKDLLGEELAIRMAEVFSGSSLYIPKNIITAEKHRAIKKEFRAGANYQELAIRYGYTQGHIRRIVHAKERSNGNA